MSDLAELRLKLVQADADLRAARIDYEFAKASGEAAIVERAGGEKALGATVESRERAFVLGLAENHEVYRALTRVLRCEKDAAEIAARIKIEEDDYRERSLRLRERYVSALMMRAELVSMDGEPLV